MSKLLQKPGWRRATPVFALLGIELLLALIFGASWVKDVPQLLAFAAEIGRFAPFIIKFRPAPYTEALQVFMAITLCLLPLKVLLLYRCVYDITPLPSRKTGVKADTIINERPSFWTILLAISCTTFMVAAMLTWDEKIRGSRAGFFDLPIKIGLAHGNFIHMWVSWNVVSFTGDAMCVAVTIHLIRLWWFFLFNKPEGDQK